MPTLQGRYWILTIPVIYLPNQPELRDDLIYIKGQQEIGANGLHHWQILAAFKNRLTIGQVKAYFCPQAHVELTRSDAADKYVHKDDTAIVETRFELGEKAVNRNSKADWELVLDNAKKGFTDRIPADILIRNYLSIKRIRVDHVQPVWRDTITVRVYWGGSGLGKTRRAWHEAGLCVYVKDPCTKWWDGYQGQENVIIDEFTGTIAINHILRWLDRYPCFAETKGLSTPLLAKNFWITSNVDPREWYKEANSDQVKALIRRCDITHFVFEWIPPADTEVRWDCGDPVAICDKFDEIFGTN
ncbi:MAG: replication associated protein [Wigfec virus K19_432]|uniref:Replication-associated protein n=1 Tax=Wigfec virus K19_432 TaxID=2985992 RepID=A0AAE9P4B4_9VIRU|nr:MAG: replication associated protein [Wigfec virus K19_432]